MRSIRSSSRARTSERGFVLLAAIVLAVLYFALMELLLLDSQRELQEAQRFRARVVATVLAENAAELAVENLKTNGPRPSVSYEDEQGKMTASSTGVTESFEIRAIGVTKGSVLQRATVTLRAGMVDKAKGEMRIDFTQHSQ